MAMFAVCDPLGGSASMGAGPRAARESERVNGLRRELPKLADREISSGAVVGPAKRRQEGRQRSVGNRPEAHLSSQELWREESGRKWQNSASEGGQREKWLRVSEGQNMSEHATRTVSARSRRFSALFCRPSTALIRVLQQTQPLQKPSFLSIIAFCWCVS